MKKYKIIWSPKAFNDLDNIYNYIKYYLKEPYIANNISYILINSISELNYFPERYTRIPNLENKNVRKLSISDYIIIYEVNTVNNKFLSYIYFILLKII